MTKQEFWSEQSPEAIEWYLDNYPFLNDFEFPTEFDLLRWYYKNDMIDRNLQPLQNFYNNYEFVFSYFIANYNKDRSEKFIADTSIERFFKSIPIAIDQTGKDLSFIGDAATGVADILSGLGSALKNFWWILVPVGVILIVKK